MSNNKSFTVHIIESPNPIDLFKDRMEGKALQASLGLASIEAKHYLIVNKEVFLRALVEIYKESLSKARPIIHISCHGNARGIEFTSGEKITWDELKNYLTPVNKNIGGFLLCMSSCRGLSAIETAMIPNSEALPFFGVVGSINDITWAEANIGFTVLYYLFKNGVDLSKAVSAMKIATNNKDFSFISAEYAKSRFNKRLTEAKIEQLKQKIQEMKEKK